MLTLLLTSCNIINVRNNKQLGGNEMEIGRGLDKEVLEDNKELDKIYGVNNGGKFTEPIKNPFRCEAEYLEEVQRINNEIIAHEEVGNDVSKFKEIKTWLDKLAYEYI